MNYELETPRLVCRGLITVCDEFDGPPDDAVTDCAGRRPIFKVTNRDLKRLTSSASETVSVKMKSSGNLSRFRLTAWFKALVGTHRGQGKDKYLCAWFTEPAKVD